MPAATTFVTSSICGIPKPASPFLRCTEAVVAIDYPREFLEIQVLDDSVDETQSIAAAAVRGRMNLKREANVMG